MWVISPRFKREGPLIFAYLLLAGIERFLVEFVRTNEAAALGLTQQQWISVALVFIGIGGMWYFETHGRLRPVIPDKPAAAVTVAGAKAGKAADVHKVPRAGKVGK